MAAWTEANVYASPNQQTFSPPNAFFCDFNFGAWEGTVQKFTPYGNVTDVTSRMHKFGEETGDE